MKKEKINQIKCHSREPLSGIPTLALFRSSSRRVGMRDINALLQTAPISRIKTLRDDEGRSTNVGQVVPDNRSCFCPPCGESAPLGAKGGLIKRGFFAPPSALQATSSAREEGNRGFTLIELLVVILIIGILAAVALPQYQKAVEKSQATDALTSLKAIYQAANVYYLAHGTWPVSFADLDVELPWSGTEQWYNLGHHKDRRSNTNWSIQLLASASEGNGVVIGRMAGKYKGAGFKIYSHAPYANIPIGTPVCVEATNSSAVATSFSQNKGDYCAALFRATELITASSDHYFRLP